MSEEREAGTRTMDRVATIYVRVLGEAVDAWRPVQAEPADGGFRITGVRPADEKWEFAPGDIVRCEKRSLTSKGRSAAAPTLVAVERVAPAIIAHVGGAIDEVSVCFAIYDQDLDPIAVSEIVGREPTSSHRRGDRRGPRSPPSKRGAWLFDIRGHAPRTVDELLTELLASIPRAAVHELRERYEVQIRIALHMDGWNKGFQLSPEILEHLASLNVPVLFDVYSYAEP